MALLDWETYWHYTYCYVRISIVKFAIAYHTLYIYIHCICIMLSYQLISAIYISICVCLCVAYYCSVLWFGRSTCQAPQKSAETNQAMVSIPPGRASHLCFCQRWPSGCLEGPGWRSFRVRCGVLYQSPGWFWRVGVLFGTLQESKIPVAIGRCMMYVGGHTTDMSFTGGPPELVLSFSKFFS